MAIGTPFHPRTQAICHSYDWRQWSGYLAVGSYNDFVQPEYAAIRNAAAVIDVSPLYKYIVSGAQAQAVVDRVMTRDIAGLRPGQAAYTPWCDADGKVRQEGTVFRLAEDRFMVTAAEPAYAWLRHNATGFAADVTDQSTGLAALSLQGPNSRAVLDEIADGAVGELPFFHHLEASIGGVAVGVSRTGYTGDLGYELWIPAEHALNVWDVLVSQGKRWQVTPCGLTAMDIARVEAGFILLGVDYVSSEVAHLAADPVTPYEIGLGWAVQLEGARFVGRQALRREQRRGPQRKLVGLEIDWGPLEEAFLAADMMPELPMTVCRESVPVYSTDGLQVGRASSRVWSKLLKKYLALATVRAAEAEPGASLEMEITVHYRRCRVAAKVVAPAFFRPPRLRD